MEGVKLSVSVRKPISGDDLIKVLRSLIPKANLASKDIMNKEGSGIGTFFTIHYPEFGPDLMMTISVGNPSEAVICTNVKYEDIWVEVIKPDETSMKDFKRALNSPDRDIVTLCQNVRDGYQKSLEYVL